MFTEVVVDDLDIGPLRIGDLVLYTPEPCEYVGKVEGFMNDRLRGERRIWVRWDYGKTLGLATAVYDYSPRSLRRL